MTHMKIKHIVFTEIKLRTEAERVSCKAICPSSVDRIQLQGIMGEWRVHIPKKKKRKKNYLTDLSFYIDDGRIVVLLL